MGVGSKAHPGPRRVFALPQLPKPHYKMLTLLVQDLKATQLEVMMAALETYYQSSLHDKQEALEYFRITPPSEHPITQLSQSLNPPITKD